MLYTMKDFILFVNVDCSITIWNFIYAVKLLYFPEYMQ